MVDELLRLLFCVITGMSLTLTCVMTCILIRPILRKFKRKIHGPEYEKRMDQLIEVLKKDLPKAWFNY